MRRDGTSPRLWGVSSTSSTSQIPGRLCCQTPNWMRPKRWSRAAGKATHDSRRARSVVMKGLGETFNKLRKLFIFFIQANCNYSLMHDLKQKKVTFLLNILWRGLIGCLNQCGSSTLVKKCTILVILLQYGVCTYCVPL